MEPKILVVSQSEETADICFALARDGFEVAVAKSGGEGLRKVYDTLPSLVILDDQLSRSDRLDLCVWIGRLPHISIILLGEEDETSLIEGLDRGADFYLSKPFSLLELAARVKALLRRKKMMPQRSGQVDVEGRRIFLDGKPIELSATEFRFLAYLMLNQGRVVSHRELLDQVWDGKRVAKGIVKSCVAGLRRKLDHGTPYCIFTHHRVGYRFDSLEMSSEGRWCV